MSHFRSYSESALIINNNNNNNNCNSSSNNNNNSNNNGLPNGCQIANNGNGFTNGIQDTNNNINNHDEDSSNMDHSNDANSAPVQHLIDTLPNGFIKINLNSQQSLERLFNPSEIEASVPLRQRNLPPSFFDPSARKSNNNGFHSRSTSFDLRQTSQAPSARGHGGIHQRTQSVLAPMTGLMSPLNSSAGSSTSNSTTKIMSDHHHHHHQQQPASQQQAFFEASARRTNNGPHSRSTSFDLRQSHQVAPPTAPRVHQRTQSVLAPMTGTLNWTSEVSAANQNGNGQSQPPIEQQQPQNYYVNANGTSQAHYGSSNSVYSGNHHDHHHHHQPHQQPQQHDQLAAGNCGNSGAGGPLNGTLNGGGCQGGDYYASDHHGPASSGSAQYDEHRSACLMSSSSSSSLNAPTPMQLVGSSAPAPSAAQYEHHNRVSSSSSSSLNAPVPVQLVSSAPTGYHYPASSSSAVHFGQPAACHSAVPLATATAAAAAAGSSQYYQQPNGLQQQQLMDPQYQAQPQQASNYSDYQETHQHQFIYQASQASECQLQLQQQQQLHHNHSHQHHNNNNHSHQHHHHHHHQQQQPQQQQPQQLPMPPLHQHHHQLPGQSHHNPIQFNYRAQHKLK